MKKVSALLILLLPLFTRAQVVSWSPSVLKDTDTLNLVFNAAKGDAGLKGYSGDIYAHTGVITDKSTSGSDWKYVKTNWGVNTPETKLTRIGTDLYRFRITVPIRTFYNVPSSEQILKLCFVFRSAAPTSGTTYKQGKDDGSKDIFVTLNQGFQISMPSLRPSFVALGDSLRISASSSPEVTRINLYSGTSLIATSNGSSINYAFKPAQAEKACLILRAYTAGDKFFAADSFYYLAYNPSQLEALPEGTEDGITYNGSTSATLVLYAPHKKLSYAIGDFSNWEADPKYQMKITPDSLRSWIVIDDLVPKQEYGFQYLVDKTIRIPDPYTEKALSPYDDNEIIQKGIYPGLKAYPAGKTSELVSIIQTDQDKYQFAPFKRPDKKDLLIYELLVRDFVSTHRYSTLTDSLGYLKRLGINAVELMPVMEFEGNSSWGYNPSLYCTPDKYYGPAEDLKKFVNEAHKNGIAVILDIALNHQFGQSPLVRLYNQGGYGTPTADNPWFNVVAKHPYNVGYDMNHESLATQYFVDRVTSFWIKNYDIDGYRFDLSKGFSQRDCGDDVNKWSSYDASRIRILKRMADKIWKVDSTSYVILEHLADNSEETELANYGMMLWGNFNNAYAQSSMGYMTDSDFSWINYKNDGWNKPGKVGYMESHDEPWIMFKNRAYGNSSSSSGYNIKNVSTGLDRIKLCGAFFFTVPGPKMIWQFGELGYDEQKTQNDPGRTEPKPLHWEYLQDPQRMRLFKTFQALIKLRTETSLFRDTNAGISISAGNQQYKRISLSSPEMSANIIGNFGVTATEVNPNFNFGGTWYDYLGCDSLNVTQTQAPINLKPGEFRIYLSKKIFAPERDLFSGVKSDNGKIPQEFSLAQNYPNPFNPTTCISYSIASASRVSLRIYDSLGREVRILTEGTKPAGQYRMEWNGRNSKGEAVASGIYIYRLQAGGLALSRKMVLLK